MRPAVGVIGMIAPAQVDEAVRQHPDLPRADVRQRLDIAVRRGWAEVGRRILRRAVLLSADLAAVGLAISLATAVLPHLTQVNGPGEVFSRELIIFLLIVQPLALGVFGAYGSGKLRREFERVVPAIVTAAVLSWTFDRFAVQPAPSPDVLGILLYTAYAIGLVYLGRRIVDLLVTFAYRFGIGQRRVLVLGTVAESRRVEERLARFGGSELKVVGTLSPGGIREPAAVGTMAELEEQLRTQHARGVIIASGLSPEALETSIRKAFQAGATVSVLPGTLHRFSNQLDLRHARTGVLFELQQDGLRFPQMATKRAMDLILCTLVLLVSWPLYLLIAILIKLDSRGPVFFKQQRAGVGGQPFKMFKFRTMVADADRLKAKLQHLNGSGDPRLFKIKNDPRVTRLGRFLRRTSLDELPQIFNVLRGEMSLVGPRPFFTEDLDTYQQHHFERLYVLPGITGLWQVSGRSDIVDFEEVVRLDSEYIRNWSVRRDLEILAKTVPAALGRGAY